MAAMALTLALFLFWTVVGRAVLAVLPARRHPLRELLLAPVCGLVFTVLPVFLLNRMNVPIGRFGPALALTMAAASLAILAVLRPPVPLRACRPVAVALLLALFLTGRPMLEFGFDWLGYCNDDMANYCLGAQRVLDHGFYDPPDEAVLLGGLDFTQSYWFMHVAGMVRPGADQVIAWAASLTGLSVHQVFMPVILAFHLILVCSAGALVCSGPGAAGRASAACFLVAFSSLTALGTVYQLIAQVMGLAMLTGGAALLMRPYHDLGRAGVARLGLLAGALVSALLIVYPEITPFLGLSLTAYAAVAYRRLLPGLRPLLGCAAVALAAVAVLLNSYLVSPLVFLRMQLAHGSDGSSREVLKAIFPYYLVPSGPAHLWGLLPVGGNPGDASLAAVRILLGVALLAVGVAAVYRAARRAEPAGAVAAVMTGLAVLLVVREDAFGLFKLSMFVQPFLAGAVVVAWWSVCRAPGARVAALLLLILAGAPAHLRYVDASRGVALSVEINDPSRTRILREFRHLVASAPVQRLVIDSYNSSLVKYFALYARGLPTLIPAADFFRFRANVKERSLTDQYLDARTLAVARHLDRVCLENSRHASPFLMHDPDDPTAVNPFFINRIGRPPGGRLGPGDFLLSVTGKQTVLNRRRTAGKGEGNLSISSGDDVRNHLVFTPSHLGAHYFLHLGEGLPMALYQLETDLTYPGQTMSALGRHGLFEVLNPSPRARLVLDVSLSLKGDGENRLPPASVIGDGRRPFPVVGRGSARVFSPPVAPQEVGGGSYLCFDLGAERSQFPDRRQGLMRLYGTDVPLDIRRYVLFARDVSAVSEEEYEAMRPPRVVERFPDDLRDRDLEYSGLYENGYCSEDCYLQLGQPEGPATLEVHGLVPLIDGPDFRTELWVRIDGREVERRTLGVGEFRLSAPVPQGATRRKVEFAFSAFQRLPKDDQRPVGAQLYRVAIVPAGGGR